MSLIALALILSAALVHATWNLALKDAPDRQLVGWLGNLIGALLYAPLLYWSGIPTHPVAWVCLIVAGLAEAVYIYLLTKAYDIGDLSLVYPLARGSAPLFVTLWAALLLRESASVLGLTGIGLAVVGLLVMSMPRLSHAGTISSPPAVALALLTGLTISFYTTVDKVGVQHASPISYGVLVFALLSLFLTPYIVRKGAFDFLRAAAAPNRRAILAIAILSPLAYLLVLTALRFTPVSYISAGREVSVVIGALLGWRLRHEQFGARRTIGAGCVTGGLIFLSLA